MDLKTLFHILAVILAGAVVIITTIGPFQNKIVIVCVLIAFGLIFEIAIPFIKVVKPPVLSYSIELIDSEYAPGALIDGVEWIDGYKRYRFEMSSNQKSSEALNVNLAFMFPTGVATYKLASQSGCEGISFPDIPLAVHNIDSNNKMFDNVAFYHNVLKTNILKIHPGGSIRIYIILSFHGPWDEVNENKDNYGLLDISYSVMEHDERSKARYLISFKDKKKKELFIDTLKTADPEKVFYSIIMPKEKIRIPFEKGSGIKFSEVPGRLEDKEKQ